MNEHTFTLDITPGGVTPVVYAVQYDNLGRTLVITLTDGSGNFVPSETVTGAYLYAGKPDGTKISLAGTWSAADSTVTVALTAQLTAAAGRVSCLLCLTGEDEKILGSAPFILQVAENPCDPQSIVSSDDFRAAVTAWVEDHQAELTELYGERLTALETATDGYAPENLLHWPYDSGTPFTANGLTYTVNDDGSLHIEGTASGSSDYHFSHTANPRPLPAGDYTLSGGISSRLRLIAVNESGTKTANNYGSPAQFTSEEGEKWSFRVRASGTVGTVDTDIYPVVERGGTAHAFGHPKYARNNILWAMENG